MKSITMALAMATIVMVMAKLNMRWDTVFLRGPNSTMVQIDGNVKQWYGATIC
jgi:hypothetical protein